ncbi:MAG: PqqD family protein [Sphingomonadales bacterium]|nr:PqqD family protein [Sphingomonadales bacterium]
MKIDDRLEISPEVVAREVGGETMLLDLASGTYFGLDTVGGRIWQALEDGASLAEACDRIEREFDVTREQLEHDVLALAGQLIEQGLATAA